MNIFRSFYSKLSLLFLILILALGTVSIAIAFTAAGHLFDEVEQMLNRSYAKSIASELSPLVKDGFSVGGIKNAIHYMMVLNPMVEIYLVDDTGAIRAYFTHPDETLKRSSIALGPVEDFIRADGLKPVLGDDPRTPGTLKPFSAARLKMGGVSGYVYVILRGQSYDKSLLSLKGNYFLRTGLVTFTLAILATLIAGFAMFFYLTRRLRILSHAVNTFESGNLGTRVAVKGSDELAALSNAFNNMAGSISEGVDRLRLHEEQRKALTANISHDLRSPLTSIRGQLETMLLKEENLSELQRKDFLSSILKNVTSFQKLVEELFELAKLENGQISPAKEPLSVPELIQDVVLKLKYKAASKNISVEADYRGGLPQINGDTGMLERVFTNILENAISHTPSGGSIRIDLNGKDGKIEVRIADSGSGIAEDVLPYVFDRFYRADKSRNRNIPGTGLGLAIAKEIVELHGGSIEARNGEPSGAEFLMTLPV